MINKYKRAFTLAEVLVTLAVIGVVASLTIPPLVKNHKKSMIVPALRQAYSMLDQTSRLIASENGGTLSGVFAGNWDGFLNTYRPYLKVAKYCHNGSCVPEYPTWRSIDGNGLVDYGGRPSNEVIVLTNGMYLFFTAETATCDAADWNGTVNCGNIFVDVNGAKPPNIFSYDIFKFRVMKDGRTIPYGSNGDAWDDWTGYTGCHPYSHLVGCTSKVLKDGAINYDFGFW